MNLRCVWGALAALMGPAVYGAEVPADFDRAAAVARIEARLKARADYWQQHGNTADAYISNKQQEPKFDDLEDDALAVVETNPADDSALNAIRILADLHRTEVNNDTILRDGHYRGRTSDIVLASRLARVLLQHHAQNPSLLSELRRLQLDADSEAGVFQEVYTTSNNRDTRAHAAALLVEYHLERLNELGVKEGERKAVKARLASYLQALRRDYADVRVSGEVHPPRRLQKIVKTEQGPRVEGPEMAQMLDFWQVQLTTTPGEVLPDVEVATLDGGKERLSQYRGKVLILDFWTTWCGPCRMHQPELIELKRELAGRPFEIIGISGDKSPQDVVGFMRKERALPWVQWFIGVDSALGKDWGIAGYPTYFIVDAEGVVHERTNALSARSKTTIRELVAKAGGAARKPLPVEVSMGVKMLGSRPALSADGALLAFTAINHRKQRPWPNRMEASFTSTGVSNTGAAGEVWIKNVDGGALTQLTDGDSSNWAPSWSPDGRSLAFCSDRDGAARLWIWNRDTGAVRRVSEAIVRLSEKADDKPLWVDGGRKILIKLIPQGATPGEVMEVTNPVEKPVHTGDKDELTVGASSSQEPAVAAPMIFLAEFGIVDVGSGEVRRFLKGVNTWDYALSADGSRLAYMTWKASGKGDLIVVSTAEGRQLFALNDQPLSMRFIWSPDGRRMAYETDGGWRLLDSRTLKSSALQDALLKDTQRATVVWDPDGRSLYRIARGPGSGSVSRIPVQPGGKRRHAEVKTKTLRGYIPQAAGVAQTSGPDSMIVATADPQSGREGYGELNLATAQLKMLYEADADKLLNNTAQLPGSGDLTFAVSDVGRYPDLYRLHRASGKIERLVAFNPEYDRYEKGKSRLIDWVTADGRKLQGALLLPAGYEPGKRYPMLVDVYGGSMGSNMLKNMVLDNNPQWDYQMLATRGYAVLVPDAPLREGAPLEDLGLTVLPGVDKAIELGIADPERLAVAGQSFGGYCVRALIVQTDRFKAAISTAAMGSNLFSLHAAGFGWYLEEGQGGMGGDPWKYRDRYLKNSPYFFFDQVKTPLLIQQGANDGLSSEDEAYDVLARLGKPVERVRYHGEGHTLFGYSNRVDFWNRRLAFLEKYLGAEVAGQ